MFESVYVYVLIMISSKRQLFWPYKDKIPAQITHLEQCKIKIIIFGILFFQVSILACIAI